MEGLTGIGHSASPRAASRRAELWRSRTPEARPSRHQPHECMKGTTFGRILHALEGLTGIEPALSAWEAEVLPLNYSPDALTLLGVRIPNQGLVFTSAWRAPAGLPRLHLTR